MPKLNNTEVIEIRRRVSEGESSVKLAQEFGIAYGTLASAVSHRTWGHLPEYPPKKITRTEPTEIDIADMRPIKGYEGKYSVTSDAKVISLERTHTRVRDGKSEVAIVRNRILKERVMYNGYPVVHLNSDGNAVTRTVHSLVANAFLPPPTEGQTQIRHKDGNTRNPRADNLERGTTYENAADKIRHGTAVQGERQWNSKLTAAGVLEMRAKAANGVKRSSIAVEYGVTKSSVDNIVNHKSWKHLP